MIDELITKDSEEIIQLNNEETNNSLLLRTVAKGLAGANVGISTGLAGLDANSFGLQKARYILVGAASGVGKTTIADQAYVLEPILNLLFVKHKATMLGPETLTQKELFLLELDIKVNYWSFELPMDMKLLKWASYLLWRCYGIRAGVDYLANVEGKGILHKVIWEKLLKVDKLLQVILAHINFYDEPENPTGIYKNLVNFAKANGQFQTTEYTDNEGNKKQRVVGYKPTNPKLYVVNVFDHLALLQKERGFNTKETMDKASEYFVYFRNRCGHSTIAIQQFNSELSSIERQKLKGYALAPQPSDFGDSKYTFRDADLVHGLFKPSSYDIDAFEGYSILPKNSSDKAYLGDAAIFLFNLKNRYGRTNWINSLALDGLVGQFVDLPLAEAFRGNFADYSEFTNKPTFDKDARITKFTELCESC
jgi:hypothetical protein